MVAGEEEVVEVARTSRPPVPTFPRPTVTSLQEQQLEHLTDVAELILSWILNPESSTVTIIQEQQLEQLDVAKSNLNPESPIPNPPAEQQRTKLNGWNLNHYFLTDSDCGDRRNLYEHQKMGGT